MDLKLIIQKHIAACLFFRRLTRVYAPYIVVKFLSIALMLCIYGFRLTEVVFRKLFQ